MSEQTATDYEQLAAPFSVTHQKDGRTYITGEQVTSRLNEVLGWDGWSFRVLEHGYTEEADELWALGELTVWKQTPIVRQQFGSQKHNRKRETKEILDLGFDLKGAATDALKKCASLIGVGLYLAEKGGGTAVQSKPAPRTKKDEAAKPTFWEVMESRGFRKEGVTLRSRELFKKDPDDLSLKEKNELYIDLTSKELASA
jgi:hypothetical protein